MNFLNQNIFLQHSNLLVIDLKFDVMDICKDNYKYDIMQFFGVFGMFSVLRELKLDL